MYSLNDLGFDAMSTPPGDDVIPNDPAARRNFDQVFINASELDKTGLVKVQAAYPTARVSRIDAKSEVALPLRRG
jgi:hypothetical protein